MLRMALFVGVATLTWTRPDCIWSPGRKSGGLAAAPGCAVKVALRVAGALMIGSNWGLLIVVTMFATLFTKWTDFTRAPGWKPSVPAVEPLTASGAPPSAGELDVPKKKPFTWVI